MTPSLFDLPLSLGDAAQLASVVLEVSGSQPRPVTDDQRNRTASRLASAVFTAMRPQYASLERDPVHPAACYLCVDGVDNQPLLLRVAPASTPSSGLFPKSILIGRTQTGLGPASREVVLNAAPFGPADHERIAVFSEQVNPAFQPRPAGSRPAIVVRSRRPAEQFPEVLAAFRRMLKSTGLNQAAFGLSEGQDAVEFYFATVWAAIRSGWREGYALQGPAAIAIPGVKRKVFESSPEVVTRVVDLPSGPLTEPVEL